MLNKTNENQQHYAIDTAVPFAEVGTRIHFIKCSFSEPQGYPLGGRYTSGTYTINGKSYNFNASGVCTNP